MKKSQELSRKTWKMIAKNLIVLAVLAVAAFIGVMSWFTQNTTAKADGINAKTQVDDGLEFYIMPPSDSDQYNAINTRLADNAAYNREHPEAQRRTTWHDSHDGATFDISDQEFNFLKDIVLCEVTSDGITFNVPKLLQYDNVAYIDTEQNFDPATANSQYMSYDIYFRTKSNQANHNVLLKSDSFISPDTDTVKKSKTYNNMSMSTDKNLKDAAIGAVRMSMLNMEANGHRVVLWIPGPYVYYNGLPNIDTLTTGVDDYSNKGAVYYTGSGLDLHNEGTNDHAYYDSNKTRQVISHNTPNSNLFWGEMFGSNEQNFTGKTVVTLGNEDKTNGYYYGRVRVNLWIEGEDAEARLAFIGGKFKFAFNYEMN